MKLQQNNDWDTIARLLADNEEDNNHSLSDLKDEDRQLFNVMKSIKLDCDYDEAYRIKNEVLEKTYRKMFGNKGKSGAGNNRNPYVILFSIAASIAILLSISNIYIYRMVEHTEEISQVVFSSPNAISNVILPDSSVVTLNAGSTITYETDYNKNQRKVCLEGEAYFDVRPADGKIFIVSTDMVEVKVLGTVFNVSAYPENGEITTSLISGSVQLDNKRAKEICHLQPGQSAVYDKETTGIEINYYDSEYAIGWMTGKLLFRKKPFSDICKTLEKKFNCTIEVKNEEIHKKLFTGKFLNDETLPEILSIIQINILFRYKTENNHITIY
ncbi:MAG: FecR family protein [Tannerellaceae bacterium]|jgi:ferric-dicitrate binding protein FerR (iron transport regulator)|nr:FecR family protein [Tannerellaceae bacterium]